MSCKHKYFPVKTTIKEPNKEDKILVNYQCSLCGEVNAQNLTLYKESRYRFTLTKKYKTGFSEEERQHIADLLQNYVDFPLYLDRFIGNVKSTFYSSEKNENRKAMLKSDLPNAGKELFVNLGNLQITVALNSFSVRILASKLGIAIEDVLEAKPFLKLSDLKFASQKRLVKAARAKGTPKDVIGQELKNPLGIEMYVYLSDLDQKYQLIEKSTGLGLFTAKTKAEIKRLVFKEYQSQKDVDRTIHAINKVLAEAS